MNAASSVMEGAGDSQNSELQRYQIPTKCSKVEFPKFDGDDLRGWLFKCEQFFKVDDTPSDAKVKLATVHLEGRALQSHQVYMKSRLTREVPNWEEYVRALYDRFGTQLYDDPMAELMNLKQVGTVQDYLDKFDDLLNHVDLSEAYAISCLFVGLQSDIAVEVRMFRPKNLQEAICLAKLQEQAIYLANKLTSHSYPFHPKPSPMPSKQSPLLPTLTTTHHNNHPHYTKPPHQPNHNTKLPPRYGSRLTPHELDEKKAKGLCFACDEKYIIRYQCSGQKQLYIMEVLEDEDEELVDEGSAEGKPDCILDDGDVDAAHDYHVSMHAIV
ncbi:UNVERIFIED_CONTAM: hypothetical protein Slati_0179300 [Sesamum latifolium]|uniref:Retrotransposon gag domain-containing protein n=1 Tax=Sesamum latifolium TaxID=2727402 RepID=A0AAW2YAU9_9LAMI